ncbi:MAG: hypothetical protein ABW036_04120, partial [Flavitalea sp.]
MHTIRIFVLITIMLLYHLQTFAQGASGSSVTLSTKELKDKIRGGWAGQTIGVTFGGPTEFRYNGTFIQDNQKIKW